MLKIINKIKIQNTRQVSYLVNRPEYSWLKELGLEEENKGVFDGEWKHGGGDVSFTFDI